MFIIFYSNKSYDVSQVGKRMVGVMCDKCGCAYYYELVRVGTGSNGDGRTARTQSQTNLEEQLAQDADPVPCPKCNWINEDLVRKHRQSHFKGCGCSVIGCASLGIIGSLLVGWFFTATPPPSPEAERFFFYSSPIFMAVCAAAVLLLGVFLRWRIQPNRDFPDEPLLPAGTAQALYQDPTTQKFVLARPRDPFVGVESGRIYFIPEHDTFPPLCVQCLAHTAHAESESITSTLAIQVPFCPPCLDRFRNRGCGLCLAASAPILLIGGVWTYQQDSFWFGGGMTVLLSLAVFFITAALYPNPWRSLSGKQPLGMVCLHFRNPEYARAVANYLAGVAFEKESPPKETDRGEFRTMP